MKRTLRLRKETLTEITDGDLAGVRGAQLLTALSCPLADCVGVEIEIRTLANTWCDNPPTFPPSCYSFPWC